MRFRMATRKEIIVNSEKDQTRIAILENGELVELYFETPENTRTLGDIYLGKVKKIMPSIQAAFVDIGQKQDAFLHFSDLSDNLPQLLSFVEEEQPEVGKIMQKAEPARPKPKRRRPRGRHHPPAPSHEKAPEEADVEEAQGEDGEAPVPDAVIEVDAPAPVGDEEAVRRHHLPDAHARGQRRSAQIRAKRKPEPSGRSSAEDDARAEAAEAARQSSKSQGKGPAKPIRSATPQEPPQRPENLLKRDQRLLVKIVKEPISNKGSRVSTDISLAGRFLVLVPLADYVAVSKKIHSYKERRRLRALAKSLLPDGFGVIVRTVAEGKNAKTLDTDLRLLLDKWRKIEKKLQGRPEPPQLVHQDVNMVSSVIRDLFSDDYDRILCDDNRLYRNIKSYVQAVAPQMVPAVQLFKQGKQHIFEATGIARDVAEAFESRVNLPTGGYLFIERTEAMHVIDVNSGRSGRGMTQEENSLRVNLESARVIAKQIRLRDLGGIIVVDFIDLRDERNKRKVYDELRKEFRRDRAVSKILPMSDFGLVQITRQRLRPSITTTFSAPEPRVTTEAVAEPAPTPAPPLPVAPEPQRTPDELMREMEQWLIDYKTRGNRSAVTLRVHPFTAAYLNRKMPNYPTRWFMKHLVRVRLETDESMSPLSFRFQDARSGADLTDGVLPTPEPVAQE